jgi:heme/copper-type cytochrome/quinol oxidase subunit 2
MFAFIRGKSRRGLAALCLAGALLALAGCAHQPPAVTVRVTMRRYRIEPDEIRLKLGQRVRFEVSSADVQHGFDVPELGIHEPLRPGKPAVFDFTPDRKGVFEMKCGILCGPGHEQMKGKIIVE